eukprot:TRINITY_DN29360_c0_g1_i1.p1 TRINITY_DN29360_c0_g1~~TRINITY_DN29360_c0_g1_i1.p1  ORF type:complete len:149 (+),score=66.17 TRINITY_DN29360_c0_g1_i1:54-500(+)
MISCILCTHMVILLCHSTQLSAVSLLFFFLMIRRPPRSTQSRSSAASDVYKRQGSGDDVSLDGLMPSGHGGVMTQPPLHPVIPEDGTGSAFLGSLACAIKVVDRSPSINKFAACLGSVSYTHLRAHETVLDLVCRLLLEKKKKKKKTM